ncbi:MAG: S41 family peptidase [Phycisphaerales bacterium]|nr:S41 family peptidase [Phycisphaerales bacterium]
MPNRSRIMQMMLVVLATLAVVQLSIAISTASPSYEWFDPLIDVRGVLVDRHLEPPDQEAMQKAVIEAMIESLEDPYALYVPDDKEKAFIKDLEGDYAGIGAEVRMVDGELVIITPMDNSPALASGILAGDVIELIEGEDTTDSTITKLVERLTGPEGTDVVVFVRHKDGTKEEITITRDHIQSPSVSGLIRRNQQWSWCLDAENGIGYIRIRQFNDTTPSELADALNLADQNDLLNGLVIDLRDNPGGALSSAITISNMFLDDGTIVTVTGRTNPQRSWDAQPNHVLEDIPILVLVNGNSASASEIVAGSLQANDRVAILGTRTFGKGSVQEVIELASGGMLKFTTARYDLSNGRTIDKQLSENTGLWGVDPNEGLVVLETVDERVDRIKKREPYIVITNDEPEGYECGDINWIEETLSDYQLAMALSAMRSQLITGNWPILSDDNPAIVGVQEEVRELAKERIEIFEELIKLEKRLASLQTELDEESESLIPEDTDLDNAVVTLTDEDGVVVGSWRVKGGNIESALDSLNLEQEQNNIE